MKALNLASPILESLQRPMLLVGLLILTFSSSAWSDGGTHFGTIFVEDLEYDNSDDQGYINHLTNQSGQQVELETLYKELGKQNQQLKKLNLGGDRNVASEKKNDDGSSRVGIVKNSELPQFINYFIELRTFEGNQPATIYSAPDLNAKPLDTIQPGEMVKITATTHEYIHKLRMDRETQGLWVKAANREQDPQNMYIYYDWRNFNSITPHEMPVEASIIVPQEKNSVPVFSRPGPWTWRDCGLEEKLCIDNIGTHVKSYVFDSTFVEMSRFRAAGQPHKLFYKIGYHLKDRNGDTRHKVGWISSEHVSRKITQLPKTLIATRGPASTSYESDEEREQRLKKYYVFESNMNSDAKAVSRWIASTPGQSTEVFFQTLAVDWMIGPSQFHLEQDFLDEEFDQTGLGIGLGVFAPIFLDLEAQGTFTLTVPISATENEIFKPTLLFKAEQWLMYTAPFAVGNLPFKFGVGGYYNTMFANESAFGYNSLVGFQGKALLEGAQTWFGVRYGPTGQDLSFRIENREIGINAGYRLNPGRKYESWTLFFDYSDTNFINSKTDSRTNFSNVQLGVSKQF